MNGRKQDAGERDAAPPVVSVVVVCMDNMGNLRRCLRSLKEHTSVPFEALVVAYLFSPENLAAARAEFPWARFVESNEIRGFSENNNLALRRARGEFCFVLNDDTELRMDAVSRLVSTIRSLPGRVAIVAPKIVWPDGRLQACGLPRKDWRHIFFKNLGLWNDWPAGRVRICGVPLETWARLSFRRPPAPETAADDARVKRSYNVSGSAFLIKTAVFRELGWFDERFFFCPEDVALSTAANRAGHEVWADAGAEVVHYGGMSGKSLSRLQLATRPANMRGCLLFYGDTPLRRALLRASLIPGFILKTLFHSAKALLGKRPNECSILAEGDWKILCTCFSRKSPKELFLGEYAKLKREEPRHGR
jgi:GT2 family glycosyltransferase